MIKQTDPRLPPEANHFACAFDSIAYFREAYQGKPWSVEELASAWKGAILSGLISGDLNGSGILGDAPEELVIQSWQSIADYLGCALQYLGKFPQGAPERIGNFAVCAWHNDRTGFTHFVVGDSRPVEWDPIDGGSVTVREGYPMPLGAYGRGGLRIFKPLIPIQMGRLSA